MTNQSDIAKKGFIGSALTLAKPTIVLSVTVTGFTGMVLASRGLPVDKTTTAIICIVCTIMSAAGSAMMNSYLDSKMDAVMPRLDSRTRAMNRIGPKRAFVMALMLIITSVVVSFVYINLLTSALILAAVLSYTVLYTLYLKRRSPYGTILGGLPGALPVLGGYTAIDPRFAPEAVILFLIMMMWQSPHFWALSLKYEDEYKLVKVPVLPVSRGESYTKILMFIYATALLPLSASLWYLGFTSGYFAAFALLIGGIFLYDCYRNVVKANRFGKAFRSSIIYIMALFLAINIDICI